MKAISLNLTAFLFLAIFPFHSIFSQCPATYFDRLDINQVNASLSNGGDHFWDFTGSPGYEVPKGSGKFSAFATSLWIGGLDNGGNLHLAAQTYRQTGNDYFPGPHRSTGVYDCDERFHAGDDVFDRGLLTLASGKVLAFYHSGFSVFDPGNGSSTHYSLGQTRFLYSAIELPDGRVLLFGDDLPPTIQDALVIDTTNFSVSALGPLNFFHRDAVGTVLNNGKVLISDRYGCEIFDPATNSSTAVGSLITSRQNFDATLLPNGKVLAVGGSPGATTTEIFDPATNLWTAGPTMSAFRMAPRLVLRSNGKVAIMGAANSPLIEEYDHSTNSITITGTLQNDVGHHHGVYNASNDTYYLNSSQYMVGRMHAYNFSTQAEDSSEVGGYSEQVTVMSNGMLCVGRGQNSFAVVDPVTMDMPGEPWQMIWKVTRAQIDQFLLDFQNSSVNFANYPDIETWPAKGDTSKGEELYLAPFIDVNQDGEYRPLQDGDYPCIEGDMALWWVFNDEGEHTESNADSLGVQIETMAYSYDCNSTQCPDSFTDFTTFYHHEITNRSTTDYHDVFIALWMDVDLGNFSDDYVGCDTNRNLAFAYNGDANDETAFGYGMNPPAIGCVPLNDSVSMSAFMYYENDYSNQGNPELPMHFYNYMQAKFKDSLHAVDNGLNGYPGTAGGPVTKYMYPGDPGFCGGVGDGGWSEVSAGNQPFDRRMLQSFGPFDLPAGAEIELDLAIVWARGLYNDNLGSVCELKAAVVTIVPWWQGLPHSCFNIVLGNEDEEEAGPEIGGFALFPNPASQAFNVRLPAPSPRNIHLDVLDISGRKVYQTVLAKQRSEYRIDAGNLPAGMYLVRLFDGQKAVAKKLIIR